MTHSIREIKALVVHISNGAAVEVERSGQGKLGGVGI